MKAFLEQIGGDWLDDFVFASKYPLTDMGFEVVPFDGDDLEGTLFNKPLNPESDVLIGSVEATTAYFKEVGIPVPKYLGYPDVLKQYLGRTIEEIQFCELVKKPYPYFIKPADGVKLFTGQVVRDKHDLKYITEYHDVTPDTNILFSNTIAIRSEWRCFVHRERIMGIQHYSGDPTLFPNVETIESMKSDYTPFANIAYTLDVGVTDYGTILVEVNDMWAIGSYGLNPLYYTRACVQRFREIYQKSLVDS